MKKPYLKKLTKISKFNVWIVDGSYIRKNIDEEFTNFAHHYDFKFIPKNEFWIDKENKGDESKYYIDHLLAEYRLIFQGMAPKKAEKKADKIEQKERRKDLFSKKAMKKISHSKKILDKIHKKLLKKYSKKINIWIVNGELIRDLFFIEFTEGGHDLVYPFIPPNEIWIDDDVTKKELKFVLLHELHERNLMSKGWCYSLPSKKCKIKKSAHRDSSRIEYYCRHHPDKTDKFLEKEINF